MSGFLFLSPFLPKILIWVYNIIMKITFKQLCDELNVVGQCRKSGTSLWQCPQFLFFIMGLVIIATLVVGYAMAARYIEEPAVVAMVLLFLAAFLLSISTIISHSFERLTEANRMKTEFVSIVTHQLRAPLTSLKWTVELLLGGSLGNDGEKMSKYLKLLKGDSDRMGELVEDLLMVSKMEEKNFVLLKDEVALEQATQKLLEIYSPFAEGSGIKIRVNSQTPLAKAYADPRHVKIIVEALIDNAIRYTRENGEINIQISGDGKNLLFKIKDSGIGIPPQDQKYIFKKFFRASNAVKHQERGSGLGLYIVKTLTEKTGGKIGFESEENKGTTFWFTLPSANK